MITSQIVLITVRNKVFVYVKALVKIGGFAAKNQSLSSTSLFRNSFKNREIMDNIQRNPLKLYIQDVYRAKQTENKYIYELFGLRFKNVMLHGTITSVFNSTETSTNLEVSDPTGTINVYYDFQKTNSSLSKKSLRDLRNNYIDASKFGDPNIQIMSTMMEHIIDKTSLFLVKEGDHISIVGDIFVDSLKNSRMISGYACEKTSIEYDIVWMEELRYLYDKCYLAK